jgi:hypothetical protein
MRRGGALTRLIDVHRLGQVPTAVGAGHLQPRTVVVARGREPSGAGARGREPFEVWRTRGKARRTRVASRRARACVRACERARVTSGIGRRARERASSGGGRKVACGGCEEGTGRGGARAF